MTLLALQDLHLDLDGAALLHGVDLAIARGERVGLVGESGCGKSLTALAVMGLAPERARLTGSIRLDGTELLGLDEPALCRIRGRRVAMIFQEPMTALNPVQTIGRQIAEGPLRQLGLSRAAAARRAEALLARVRLDPARFPLSLYPHQLSGGQRQRVMIAIALASDPELLVADEPTTALDVTVQAEILRLIDELVRERGMGLLLITHDLGVVAAMTDRMAVMYAGTVVEQGATAEVFAHMAHPYTRALLAARPREVELLKVEHAPLTTIPGQVASPRERPQGCAFWPRCPRMGEPCRSLAPALRPVAPGHDAACHFPHTEDRP
jgi:peptide/nickel transport system ATP-binding protein